MARGTALSAIRSMLKAEIGDFSGTNTTSDNELNARISTEQKRLSALVNWSFLERHWDVAVAAGQQFINFPTITAGDPEIETTAINLQREPKAEVLWSQKYNPITYGIGAPQYNTLNFHFGETSDPIQRWRIATNIDETVNADQFEVWPVPTSGQTVRFTGQRTILTLSADTDTADLDDLLIVYFVAANILAREKQADYQLVLQKAQALFQMLRQQDKQTDKFRVRGQGVDMGFEKDRKLVGIGAAGGGGGGIGPGVLGLEGGGSVGSGG